MAIECPAWLDAPYLQKVLRNAEKDESIQVHDITVKAATAKGDNYSSDMYRVNVEFSRVRDGHEIPENRSVIVKVAPQGDLRGEMISSAQVFEKEFLMISVTLPRMAEILGESSSTTLGARHLHVQYESPIHAVIEDLAVRGFRMADRHAGLDLDHSSLALRNLGRFHAASVALKEKDPNAFADYTRSMLHKDQSTMIQSFFNSSARALGEEAVKWSEIDPRIPEKLLKLSEVMFKKGSEATMYREDDFNVLNHGDFWLNNMLFRYDEQRKPIDHIFVDFQISHYGSPAFDILYFFGTTPTDEIRLHHRELLLREYHTSLANTMVRLKCKTPVLSFEKLQEVLKKQAFCEAVASISVLPFVVLEKGEVIDMDEILNQDSQFNHVGYRGKTYRKIMTRLLPLYDSMGLLDI